MVIETHGQTLMVIQLCPRSLISAPHDSAIDGLEGGAPGVNDIKFEEV